MNNVAEILNDDTSVPTAPESGPRRRTKASTPTKPASKPTKNSAIAPRGQAANIEYAEHVRDCAEHDVRLAMLKLQKEIALVEAGLPLDDASALNSCARKLRSVWLALDNLRGHLVGMAAQVLREDATPAAG